jgi:hypothetical protein
LGEKYPPPKVWYLDYFNIKRPNGLLFNTSIDDETDMSKVLLQVRQDAIDVRRGLETYSPLDCPAYHPLVSNKWYFNKESQLMKYYFLYVFPDNYQRKAVQQVLFQPDVGLNTLAIMQQHLYMQDKRRRVTHKYEYLVFYGVLALWLCVVGALIYGSYMLGGEIGSRSTSGIYIYLVSIAMIQEFCFVELFAIYAKYVWLYSSVGKLFREHWSLLFQRSHLILVRSRGLMVHATDLVQHYNPACRIARFYPHWPVSRLLFSLNDYDLPLKPVYGRWALLRKCWTDGSSMLMSLAAWFTYLPMPAQETYLNLVSIALLNGVIIGFHHLGLQHSFAGWFISSLVILSILMISVAIAMYNKYQRDLKERYRNLNMFRAADQIDPVAIEEKIVEEQSLGKRVHPSSAFKIYSDAMEAKMSDPLKFSINL